MALNVLNKSDSVYAQDDANTVDLDPDLSMEKAALIVLRNTTLKVRLTKSLSKILIIIQVQEFLLCI